MSSAGKEEKEREHSVVWTREQAEAIEKRGANILVSAAAGSGKTAVLVERIKKLIEEEHVSLDEMLIVTFTNAAASEMREKIVTAIPEQADQIHKSHISTFHSFSLDVIRRYFHLIDVEPGFRVCDETQRVLLQNLAMDELFRLKFEEGEEAFLAFLKSYATGKNEEAVRNIILETHTFIQSLPDPLSWLSEKAEVLKGDILSFRNSSAFREILDDIFEQLETALFSALKVKKVLEAYFLKALTEKAEEDIRMLREIQGGFVRDFEAGAELVARAKFRTFTPTKEEKENYEAVKEDVNLLRQEMKDALKNISSRYCARTLEEYVEDLRQTASKALTLYHLVDSFDWLYARQKEKQGVIDFSDIEHYALRILAHEEAAEEYRRKFKYIFIDEYQDTNTVQETLIRKIARENNLFMVGDVKQSIYKFRLAEPEIFIEKYEKYRDEALPQNVKIDLNRNFRSKQEIIKTVNNVFEKVMTKRRAGMVYDEAAELKRGVSYSGPLDHPVELYLLDERVDDEELDDEIREMKRAELEAAAAALIVRNAKGLSYYNVKEEKEKPLQNKDIVILLRSTANVADIYHEALQKEGIPSYMDIGDGYFDTLEVSVFLNLLKVIDNRRQDVPLLSALRSPVFGFSVRELAVIRSEHRRGSFFEAFSCYGEGGLEEPLQIKCQNALTQLDGYRRKGKLLPLGEFVWELLLDCGYYSYAAALPGGVQRQANLRALADKASAYENNFSKGLFGFINYIEAIKKGKIASAPVKLIGESDDVVRIMTVHKSKGLEFPMVLVGGLGRRFRIQSSDRVAMHKDLGISLKLVDRKQRFQKRTLLQEIIDRRKNREDLAEEIRILYVALTRAMDKLVLLGTVSDVEKTLRQTGLKRERGLFGESCYFDFLLPAIGFTADVKRRILGRKALSLEKQRGKARRDALNRILFEEPSPVEQTDEMTEVFRRLSFVYPYSEGNRMKSKYSVSELASEGMVHFEKASLSGTQAERFAAAARRGTIYHKVMERIPFSPGGMDEVQIRDFLLELVAGEYLTEEESSLVDPERISAFYHSEIGQRLCRAKEVYREVPFNLKQKKDGEDIIVQGTIDCFFKERDHYVLLDYKTNAVKDSPEVLDSLKEAYRLQLAYYKEALEAIRGIQIEESYLYVFEIGREIQL